MCGLFGACGPGLSAKDREAVTILGNLSVVRGKDSTGLFTGLKPAKGSTRGLKFKTYKDIVEAPAFMASKTVKGLMQEEPFVIGGHTRLATHGKVNVANAHPYTVGHFIGTHNGVISDLYDRVNDKTDSEVLFTNMMKHGVEKGIRSGLDLGDMALVFINKSNGTLNYFRNGGRPLFIGVEEKKKKFFWASTKDFLEFIEKHKLVKFSNLYSVEPFMLHTVNLNTMKTDATEIKSDKPVQHFIPSSTLYPLSSTNQRTLDENLRSTFNVKTTYEPVPSSRPTNGLYLRKITPVKSALKVSPAVQLPAPPADKKIWFRGYDNVLMEIKDTARLTRDKNGCDCCGKGEYSIFRTIWWLSPTRWLCTGCYDDPKVIELCYEGEQFTKGCLVDKNNVPKNVPKAPTHPENEIPF